MSDHPYSILRKAAEILRNNPDSFNPIIDIPCTVCKYLIRSPEKYFIIAGKFYHPMCWYYSQK